MCVQLAKSQVAIVFVDSDSGQNETQILLIGRKRKRLENGQSVC